MECSSLVLNHMQLRVSRLELEGIGSNSRITSLVVMNSFYDEVPTFSAPHPRDPQDIPPTFLVNLRTLSLDRSPLGMQLLKDYYFPAVTTFELIPDLRNDSEDHCDHLILTTLLKFPSLKKVSFPLSFCQDNSRLLLEGYGEGHIKVELAIENQWNWLGSLEEESGETSTKESDDGESEEDSAYFAKYDEGWY